MPRATTINSLPDDVRAELWRRLQTMGFGNYEAHAAWLKANGFVTSKSAIHRYASTHAVTILANQQGLDVPLMIDARLRCLEVARSLEPSSAADLMRDAEALLKWVYKL